MLTFLILLPVFALICFALIGFMLHAQDAKLRKLEEENNISNLRFTDEKGRAI